MKILSDSIGKAVEQLASADGLCEEAGWMPAAVKWEHVFEALLRTQEAVRDAITQAVAWADYPDTHEEDRREGNGHVSPR